MLLKQLFRNISFVYNIDFFDDSKERILTWCSDCWQAANGDNKESLSQIRRSFNSFILSCLSAEEKAGEVYVRDPFVPQ